MKRMAAVAVFIFFLCSFTNGQTFSSGSTGVDGPLDLTSGDRTIQLPESGILNYTTVNIPTGKTLTFKKNSRNTPVYMLAQGNVTIAGGIALYASYGVCGGIVVTGSNPGGFRGGQIGQTGFGPGGGQTNGQWGAWVGPLSLVPIIGGSGAAGLANPPGYSSFTGGDGGGAIVIASSTTITLSGGINANGGGYRDCYQGGGYGSGGAIRLVANSLSVSGSLSACGGSCGVVRLEAPEGALTFTGSSTPAAVLSPINPAVVSSTPPLLTIVSVGGYAVPSYAGQRTDAVDLLLPNQLTDPITVVVQGNNIPVGTQVSISFVTGAGTSSPAALQGTFSSSSASPTISSLNRAGVTYFVAFAQFDPPAQTQKFNTQGTDHVDKVRVEVIVGARPKYTFLRKDGTSINPGKLSPKFLQEFGM